MSLEKLKAVTSLTQITLTRRFPPQEVRRLFGNFETAFASYLSPQADIFPTPVDAPPDTPRFGLKGNKKGLAASNNQVQLTLDFSAGRPASGVRPALVRAAEEMDKLDDVLHQARFFCGITVGVTLPAAPEVVNAALEELGSGIFAKRPPSPYSFGLNLWHQKDGLVRALEASEVRQFQFQGQPGQTITVDLDFTETSQHALHLKADVNTRPAKDDPQPGNFQRLVDPLAAFVGSEVQEFFGDMIRLD